MQFILQIALIAIALPLVASHNGGGSSSCSKNEFWYVIWYVHLLDTRLFDLPGTTTQAAVFLQAGLLLSRALRQAMIVLRRHITGARTMGAVFPHSHPPRTSRLLSVRQVGIGIRDRTFACLTPPLPTRPHLIHPATTAVTVNAISTSLVQSPSVRSVWMLVPSLG